MLTVAWTAILLASIALPLTSCRIMILGAAERVETEAGEVGVRIVLGRVLGFGGASRLLRRVAHARVRHGLRVVVFLGEDPIVGLRRAALGDPLFVPPRQRAPCQRPLAVLGLRLVHVAAAVALRDFDGAGGQVHVPGSE